MRLQDSRSITLSLLVLSLAACPGDPSPIDTTDGSTTNDPSTSADPTSNTGPSTTDEPTSTTVGTTATTTTGDPTDTETTSTTAVDTSTSTDTSETTHGSHDESSSTDAESSSTAAESSSTAAESSSSSDGGVNPDCEAGDGPVFTVTNNGQVDYVINGQNDPGITVVRGCEYTFDIAANGHPFYIKTIQGAGVGNAYGDGVVGNGTSNGDLTWTVADDAPDDLFYNCSFHVAMTGTITVIDP